MSRGGSMENLWLVWASIGIFLWAMANVLDNYFTEDSYLDEYTGLAVSALFNFFPVIFILIFVSPDLPRIFWVELEVKEIAFGKIGEVANIVNFLKISFSFHQGIAAAFVGGVLLMITYLAYFKCLFSFNDNVALQIAWCLSSPLILLMGWFFLGDEMTDMQYVGAGLIFLGVLFLDFRKFEFKKGFGAYIFWALMMNFAYSSHEILMKVAYEIEKVPFWTAFLFFTLGQLTVGMASVILRWKTVWGQRSELAQMIKRFWIIFIIAEIVEQFAALCTQRAVDTTPLVSFYGALEAGMPVYVLLVGLAVSLVLRIPFFNKKEVGEIIWGNFKVGLQRKLLATAVVVIGVYLLT